MASLVSTHRCTRGRMRHSTVQVAKSAQRASALLGASGPRLPAAPPATHKHVATAGFHVGNCSTGHHVSNPNQQPMGTIGRSIYDSHGWQKLLDRTITRPPDTSQTQRDKISLGSSVHSLASLAIAANAVMTILKNVPRILPPRLIYAMAQMGHGDELVLADANFPAHRISKDCPGGLINCDGSDIPTLLSAILSMLPLDEVAPPCVLMSLMEEHRDAGYKTPIWMSYKMIADRAHGRQVYFEEMERFAFYERAKKAYAVVATGETALYGNLILKKGTIGTAGKET